MMIKMKQIFSLFVCLLFCVIGEQARAESLHYNAYGAGMHLMTAEMNYEVSDTDFNIKTMAKTNGLLKMVLDAESEFYSDVKVLDNQMVVNNSYIKALSKNKYKNRQLDFKNKPEFMDYQTALFQVMQLPEPQDKTFHVFDGKRELLLTFKYMGQTQLLPSSQMMYSGPADYYTLTIDITKGKKKGWFFNRMGNKDNPPLHLYFANIDGVNQKVMVKGAFDTTLFGQIAVYLTHIFKGEKVND